MLSQWTLAPRRRYSHNAPKSAYSFTNTNHAHRTRNVFIKYWDNSQYSQLHFWWTMLFIQSSRQTRRRETGRFGGTRWPRCNRRRFLPPHWRGRRRCHTASTWVDIMASQIVQTGQVFFHLNSITSDVFSRIVTSLIPVCSLGSK